MLGEMALILNLAISIHYIKSIGSLSPSHKNCFLGNIVKMKGKKNMWKQIDLLNEIINQFLSGFYSKTIFDTSM